MVTIIAGMAAVLAGGCQTGDCAPKPKTTKAQTPVYRTMDTNAFTLQVPSGWTVSEETPWGARDISPEGGADAMGGATMSSMTGPGLGRSSWKQLYETSLYFITRGDRAGKMTATPYELGKSKQGYETCSWAMKDGKGRVVQRHVILKHSNGNILALSAKTPASAEKQDISKLDRMFRHMTETAIVK
ncbi:MAG: hypothetical protein FJX72_03695 [Armatimonadetes bacterium]|nr:hypothetical protein [Armatimonadota bacterium]